MGIEIGVLFEGLGLAKSVAEYLGIIESLDIKLDRLANSELEAGNRELQQAIRSSTEQTSLLQSARNRFNKAIELEKGDRRCLSFVGLAICHRYLNDHPNANQALRELLQIDSTISNKNWAVASLKDENNPKVLFTKERMFDFKFEALRKVLRKEAVGPATQKLVEEKNTIELLQQSVRAYLADAT